MDSPTILYMAFLAVPGVAALILLLRRPPDAPALVAAVTPPPIDHTPAMIQLVRDTLGTLERIAVPSASPMLDYEPQGVPAAFDMDSLDPTDTTPWLLAGNTPYENTVNVAPEPATHPMGIPGLEPPLGMQWGTQQYSDNLIYRDGKSQGQPFDRFRVDV